jgi:hypothetical protein
VLTTWKDTILKVFLQVYHPVRDLITTIAAFQLAPQIATHLSAITVAPTLCWKVCSGRGSVEGVRIVAAPGIGGIGNRNMRDRTRVRFQMNQRGPQRKSSLNACQHPLPK